MRSRSPVLATASPRLLAVVTLVSVVGCSGSAKTPAISPDADRTISGSPADATLRLRTVPAAPSEQPQFQVSDVARPASEMSEREVSPASTAAGASTPAPSPNPPVAPQATQPSAAMKPPKPDPAKEPAQSRDLVIYTAQFTMAVYQVDQGLAAVEKIARDNGGYLGLKKDREITVRIPRGRFETTLAAVDKIGDVLHRQIQAEDVTDEHVDLEIRIKNARAMQRRLSELLSRASVKDALEIEKELHRVTEELERLEGRMKVLVDRVAFSTITVAFEARGSQIQTTRARLPFPWLGAVNLPSLLSLTEDK